MDLIFILLFAVLIDLTVGEYPVIMHPTVWTGRLIGFIARIGLSFKPRAQFLFGTLLTLGIIGVSVFLVWFLIGWLKGVDYWLYIFVGAFLLKPAFCLKQQWQVANKTRRILEGKVTIPSEMRGLFDTVSHKGELTRDDIISSSVRSLAENASDFVTAPLFYYLFFGIPGAIAYRIINTLDNMIGYHGQYEYLGKFGARLDDIANYIPARLTGFLIVISSWFNRLDIRQAWKTMLAEHGKTPGPNGGWTMAAASGALGVNLFKSGCYQLGRSTNVLTPGTIEQSVQLYGIGMMLWISLCFTLLFLMLWVRGGL